MAFEQLTYEVRDGVATITFNRPERMNALTKIMEREIREAMDRAGQDAEVRAIVLTGAGRAFCAGMDMQMQLPYNANGTLWTEPIKLWDVSAARSLPYCAERTRLTIRPTLTAVTSSS